MKIILGSGSKNRKYILEKAGYTFDILVSDIDEKAIRTDNYLELPLLIARAKAAALLPKIKEPAVLIAADQIVLWNGELREKPANSEEARYFLESYSNSSYPAECINGIVVVNTSTGKKEEGVETSKIYFSKIPAKAIDALLRESAVFSWAGGFTPQHGLIKPYISRTEGAEGSIMGLPLAFTEELMRKVIKK